MCTLSGLRNSRKTRTVISILFLLGSFKTSMAMAIEEKIVTNHNIVTATEDAEVPPSEHSLQINSKGTTFKMGEDNKSKWVPQAELYPDGALQRAYQDEVREQQLAEEKERKLIRERDEYERKKVEAEHEIASKKHQIEGYKVKQEQAQMEIDAMKTELTDLDGQANEVQKELATIEERTKAVASESEEKKGELEKQRIARSQAIEKLRTTREKAALSINNMLMGMEKMRAEVAVAEADIARAENDKARAQAEEVRVRTEWASLQQRTSQVKADKRSTMESLEEVNKRVQIARSELRQAQQEYEIAEKDRKATESKYQKEKTNMLAEMKNIENSIVQAKGWKVAAETEKARLDAENSRLKQDLAIARNNSLKVQEQLASSQGLVMESRLAIENTKAEIAREMNYTEASKLREDTRNVKIRALASLAESSDMLEVHRPFLISKSCKVRRQPSSTGEEVGIMDAGRRVIAAPAPGGFLKVLNGSGKPAYIQSSCGGYVEGSGD